MPNFQACKAAIEQARDSNSLYAAFQLLHTSLMNDANCKCTKEDVVKVCRMCGLFDENNPIFRSFWISVFKKKIK